MKNAKQELGKLIRNLKIEDKALESVIRHLVFQNNEKEIKYAFELYMPETKVN